MNDDFSRKNMSVNVDNERRSSCDKLSKKAVVNVSGMRVLPGAELRKAKIDLNRFAARRKEPIPALFGLVGPQLAGTNFAVVAA